MNGLLRRLDALDEKSGVNASLRAARLSGYPGLEVVVALMLFFLGGATWFNLSPQLSIILGFFAGVLVARLSGVVFPRRGSQETHRPPAA